MGQSGHSARLTVVSRTAVAVALIAFAVARPAFAASETPITDCSDDVQIQQDVSVGGSYVFTCSGTITLSQALTVSTDLTLDGGSAKVTLSGQGTDRLFTIDAGHVTISGLTLEQGVAPVVSANSEPTGADGADGAPGQPGGPGQLGPNASPTPTVAQGGAVYVAAGANVSLVNDNVTNNFAPGGSGGFGGSGGQGGEGGTCDSQGNGGAGGNGGDAGQALPGKDGMGGGVYVSQGASLTVTGSTFSNDLAEGGGGGSAGDNGNGGLADGGFSACNQADPAGQPGAPADGQNAGSGYGGAIYAAGTVEICSATFGNDSAQGGGGGEGSRGYSNAVSGVRTGLPGNGGSGGNGSGGAIYGPTSVTNGSVTFSGDSAVAGAYGPGGDNNNTGVTGTNGSPGTATGTDAYPAPTVRPSCGVTLSGQVTESNCTEASCQSTGVPGVQVSASGTTDAGAATSATATSDSNGNYSIDVPPGSYTVSPEQSVGPWYPPDQQVQASADTSGVNFSRCAAAGGEAAGLSRPFDAPVQPSPRRCTFTHLVCHPVEFPDPTDCTAFVADISGQLPKTTVDGDVVMYFISSSAPHIWQQQLGTATCILKGDVTAQCSMNVFADPGLYDVAAIYQGSPTYASSSGSTEFSVVQSGPRWDGHVFSPTTKEVLDGLYYTTGLGSLVFDVAAIGGAVMPEPAFTKLTAVGAKAISIGLKATALLCSYLKNKVDPFDPDYTVIAVPHAGAPPTIPGQNSALKRTIRAYASDGLQVTALTRALSTTVNRATSANRADDVAARTAQLGAAGSYIQQLVALIQSEINLQHDLMSELRRLHGGSPPLFAKGVDKVRKGLLVALIQDAIASGVASNQAHKIARTVSKAGLPRKISLGSALDGSRLIRGEHTLVSQLLRAAANPDPAALPAASLPAFVAPPS
jgi:hypothetical protein